MSEKGDDNLPKSDMSRNNLLGEHGEV